MGGIVENANNSRWPAHVAKIDVRSGVEERSQRFPGGLGNLLDLLEWIDVGEVRVRRVFADTD